MVGGHSVLQTYFLVYFKLIKRRINYLRHERKTKQPNWRISYNFIISANWVSAPDDNYITTCTYFSEKCNKKSDWVSELGNKVLSIHRLYGDGTSV